MIGLWIYVVLMSLVTFFTVYEAIGYYKEYSKGKEKKDMLKFIIKILTLVALVILLVQLINWAISLPEFIRQ